MSPKIYSIASIPGDGIGVDITQAAEKVLHKLASVSKNAFAFEFTTFDWSSKAYLERGCKTDIPLPPPPSFILFTLP